MYISSLSLEQGVQNVPLQPLQVRGVGACTVGDAKLVLHFDQRYLERGVIA